MSAPRRLRLALITLCAVAGTSLAPHAEAHLLPAQTATVHVVGDSAYVVVAAPLSAFRALDAVGPRLTPAELARHRAAIVHEFEASWQLTEAGAPGRVVFTWVANPETDGVPREGSSYVVLLQRVQFPAPPRELAVATTLFGRGPGEDTLSLHASRGSESQITVLTPRRPRHELFPGPLATLVEFLGVGIEHILEGGDHLLFLLTVITAAAGWRYWLAVITSFTVAHSITLTLAAYGRVHVDPALVEPAIAASIVVMAAANLLGRSESNRIRIALVFGCGLLHGLGFASALGDLGVDSQHRLATLIGFNLGVECGQFAFLAGVLALMRLAARGLPGRITRLGPRTASATAAGIGTLLFFERLVPAVSALR